MYRQTHFQFGPAHTPDVIKTLLIANGAVFLLQQTALLGGEFGYSLMATPRLFWEHGYLWQPFTYMWMHAGVMHLLFNMLALWMFGSEVAEHLGPRRFMNYYLTCGVGAGALIVTWPALLSSGETVSGSYMVPTLGASGAVYGVLLAHSLMWPERRIMLLFPPIPLKAIYLIPLLFFLQLGQPGVSHIGHLGGVLVGLLMLRRIGIDGGIGFAQLRHRWRRYRMRRKLKTMHENDTRPPRDRDLH